MKRLRSVLSTAVSLLLMLLLPFWLLFRGTIYLYQVQGWWFGFGLILMTLLVGLLLLVYVAMIWDAVFGANKITRRSLRGKVWVVSLLLIGYLSYTAFSFSAANAKSEVVAAEFRELHPLLRMGVGTFIFLDPTLMVTDMAREPEDYRRMGLTKKAYSLHFPQPDGYVHAIDLRTRGRAAWKNTLLSTYFRVLGFRTLRHIGTADHLHVSLVWPPAPQRL